MAIKILKLSTGEEIMGDIEESEGKPVITDGHITIDEADVDTSNRTRVFDTDVDKAWEMITGVERWD